MKLRVEGISHNGEGVARYSGKVVFIPYAIPGETIEAEIMEEKKNYSRGIIKEIIIKSPHRVKPTCPHYYNCGGCSYQHIKYGLQLKLKENTVRETIKRIGGLCPSIMPMFGMENPWNYRNKVLWHVGEDKDGKKIGFFRSHSKQIIEIGHCPLLLPGLNSISQLIGEFLQKIRLDKNCSIMIRQSDLNKEILVEFIHCSPDRFLLKSLSEKVHAVYEKRNGRTMLLSGNEMIKEKKGNWLFYLGADDFFQVNSVQIEHLLQTVIGYLGTSGNEKVLDAYCGVGIFSLNIAGQVSSVTGIDLNPSAIKHARINARLNNITNCKFIAGSCEKVIPGKIDKAYDQMLLDPPRSGVKKEVIYSISKILPETIVYISCNTGTLARDLKLLNDYGYCVSNIQPIDMFPQTSHIENVALLHRVKL